MNNSSSADYRRNEELILGSVYLLSTMLTMPPYVLCLLAINAEKTMFDPSFRVVVLNMGVVDIGFLAIQGIYTAVGCFLLVDYPRWLAEILGASGSFFWFAYLAFAQVMCADRFTRIFSPTLAKKMYTDKVVLISNSICYLHGLLWFGAHMLPNVAILFEKSVFGINYDLKLSRSLLVLSLNMAVNWTHAITLCIAYSLIYVKIQQQRSEVRSITEVDNEAKDRKILIQSCILCMKDVLVVVSWSLVQAVLKNEFTIFIIGLMALYRAGITAYLYIFWSSVIREKIRQLMKAIFHVRP